MLKIFLFFAKGTDAFRVSNKLCRNEVIIHESTATKTKLSDSLQEIWRKRLLAKLVS